MVARVQSPSQQEFSFGKGAPTRILNKQLIDDCCLVANDVTNFENMAVVWNPAINFTGMLLSNSCLLFT